MAKVLIIDDDNEIATLLEAIAKEGGHTTQSINDSKSAIHIIQNAMPDLILLDIMMPEINGIAICKMIKSNPLTREIKVMIVSALNDNGTKRDCANAGADQFVSKPILPGTLIEQIQKTLAH